MLRIALVGTTWARNIAQGFPHVLLIHRWIKKSVDPTQWVHGIGNIVQPAVSPVIAQCPVDPFSSQNLTQMPNMVFPRRGDTRADQARIMARQNPLGYSLGPVWRACLTHMCVLVSCSLRDYQYCAPQL